MPQDDSMMIARRKKQYKQTVDERLPCLRYSTNVPITIMF